VAQVRRAEVAYFPVLDDPILDSVREAAAHMNEIQRFEVSPIERGIVLFEAARKALHRCDAAGRLGHMHEAHHDDPPEIAIPEDDEDVPEYAYMD